MAQCVERIGKRTGQLQSNNVARMGTLAWRHQIRRNFQLTIADKLGTPICQLIFKPLLRALFALPNNVVWRLESEIGSRRSKPRGQGTIQGAKLRHDDPD